MRDDYIKQFKLGTCMAMQTKTWMTTFLFKLFLSFFNWLLLGGISQTNCHLLILDGHGPHVTLDAIKQAMDFRLNIITLLSHTSYGL